MSTTITRERSRDTLATARDTSDRQEQVETRRQDEPAQRVEYRWSRGGPRPVPAGFTR